MSFVYRAGELFPKDPATGLFQHLDVPIKDTWAAMEKLVSAGKIKSIGVSNFTIDKVEELLETAKIPPAVNQIEAHPWLQQPKLFDYLKSKVCQLPRHARKFERPLTGIPSQNILIESYSPLGNNIYGLDRWVIFDTSTSNLHPDRHLSSVVDDPTIQAIAKRLNVDAGQMLVNWAVQRGTVVLPKSVTPSRIESNLKSETIPNISVNPNTHSHIYINTIWQIGLTLPQAEFEELNGLDKHKRFNLPSDWAVDIFGEVGQAEIERRAKEAADKKASA